MTTLTLIVVNGIKDVDEVMFGVTHQRLYLLVQNTLWAKDRDLRSLSGWADELDLVLNQSGALVGQGSALIAYLRIQTLFRRRPTEALGQCPIVMVQPMPRSLVCPLYVIKSPQSSKGWMTCVLPDLSFPD
ncbi:hypothetical protein Tco_1496653 [Tanacetum coccineum]